MNTHAACGCRHPCRWYRTVQRCEELYYWQEARTGTQTRDPQEVGGQNQELLCHTDLECPVHDAFGDVLSFHNFPIQPVLFVYIKFEPRCALLASSRAPHIFGLCDTICRDDGNDKQRGVFED